MPMEANWIHRLVPLVLGEPPKLSLIFASDGSWGFRCQCTYYLVHCLRELAQVIKIFDHQDIHFLSSHKPLQLFRIRNMYVMKITHDFLHITMPFAQNTKIL